jgi:hypothetical protein
LKEIAAANEPVQAAKLGSLPELGRKVPGLQVRGLLEEDLAAGKIFLWGSSSKPAFWNESAENIARERLLKISADEVLTKAALGKRAASEAPKLKGALVKQVQKALLSESRLREVPAAAGSKSRRVLNTGAPEPYLEAEISGLLERFGMPRSAARIRTLLEAETSSRTRDAVPRSEEEGIGAVAETMFAAMNRLAFAPGTTVTFFRLRQEPELSHVPKRIFDQAALLLQAERRALLSVHDHAGALPKEEQDRFVTDGLGRFYVSIYAR